MQMQTIICPICGNEEIAFVSENHKCIGVRIFQLVLIIIALTIATYCKWKLKSTGYIALVFSIPMLITQAYIYCTESRSHVQCICKECGYVWLHT